jgi:hypothetical protein
MLYVACPDAGGLAANGAQSNFLAEAYFNAHVRQLWYGVEHPNHYETGEPGGSLMPVNKRPEGLSP